MKIIIVGPACSGKTYLRDSWSVLYPNIKIEVSYTTRPPRDGEIDGKTYNFVTMEQFNNMVEENLFKEFISFNGWYYGTTLKGWDECDVFIRTPEAIALLTPEERKTCKIVYLNPPDNILTTRLIARSMPGDNAQRRQRADFEQFKNFKDFDIMITNHVFNPQEVYLSLKH